MQFALNDIFFNRLTCLVDYGCGVQTDVFKVQGDPIYIFFYSKSGSFMSIHKKKKRSFNNHKIDLLFAFFRIH